MAGAEGGAGTSPTMLDGSKLGVTGGGGGTRPYLLLLLDGDDEPDP